MVVIGEKLRTLVVKSPAVQGWVKEGEVFGLFPLEGTVGAGRQADKRDRQ